MACKLANLDFGDFGCFLEQIVISRCPFLGSKNRCNWSRKTFFSTFFGFLVNLSHFQFFWKKSLKKKNFVRFLDPKNVFFRKCVKRCILWKKMKHFTRFPKNTFSGLKNGRKNFFSNFFFKKTRNGLHLPKKQKKLKKKFFCSSYRGFSTPKMGTLRWPFAQKAIQNAKFGVCANLQRVARVR